MTQEGQAEIGDSGDKWNISCPRFVESREIAAMRDFGTSGEFVPERLGGCEESQVLSIVDGAGPGLGTTIPTSLGAVA